MDLAEEGHFSSVWFSCTLNMESEGSWEIKKNTLSLSTSRPDLKPTVFKESGTLTSENQERTVTIYDRNDSSLTKDNILIAVFSDGDTTGCIMEGSSVSLDTKPLKSIKPFIFPPNDTTYYLQNPLSKDITIYLQTEVPLQMFGDTCWVIKRRYIIPCDMPNKKLDRLYKYPIRPKRNTKPTK